MQYVRDGVRAAPGTQTVHSSTMCLRCAQRGRGFEKCCVECVPAPHDSWMNNQEEAVLLVVLGGEGDCCSCYVGRRGWSDQPGHLPASHTTAHLSGMCSSMHTRRLPRSCGPLVISSHCCITQATQSCVWYARLVVFLFLLVVCACVVHLVVVYRCSRSLVVPASVAAFEAAAGPDHHEA